MLSFPTGRQGHDRKSLVQSSLLSFHSGGRGHDSREDWTKSCQNTRGQNLVQSSLLSLPTGNQAERIEPSFARTLARKTWSNPPCCHFLQVVKDMTGNFARTFAGKIWSNHICCHFIPITKEMTARRIGPNFARTVADRIWANPLCGHFLQVAKDMTATKDWTKFCQDICGQNLVQSSVLSFPTGGQEHDSNEGLDQILPGHSQAEFGPILRAVISYRWSRT